MKIEILFPEFCNLFGDTYNMIYLEKTLPQAGLSARRSAARCASPRRKSTLSTWAR